MYLAKVVRESFLEEVVFQMALETGKVLESLVKSIVQGLASRLMLTWPSWENKVES